MTEQSTVSPASGLQTQQDQSPVPVLEARGVSVTFQGRDASGAPALVRACREADLALHRQEIVALVGESGSGKTTLAKALCGLVPVSGGSVLVEGREREPGQKPSREFFSKVQFIFQDPFASLNSLKKIRHIIGRALVIHGRASGRKATEAKIRELLTLVNLTPAEDYIDRFPGSMSGGQRQRVSIARALAVGPSVLLADEPTSMLDVSIRLDVLNLFEELRRDHGVAILYITHDIASARYISDRIAVMYSGCVVESGPTEDIVQNPLHPYTKLLMSSAPDPARRARRAEPGDSSEGTSGFDADFGEPADPAADFPGCRFRERCPMAIAKCAEERPLPRAAGERTVACWRVGPDALDGDAEAATTPEQPVTTPEQPDKS